METTPDKFLDLRGLSEYSSLAVPTLRDYLKGFRPIPHFKVKGKILVRKSEFDEWMEGRRIKMTRLDEVVDGVMNSLIS